MRSNRLLHFFIVVALASAYLWYVVPDCIRMHPVTCLGTSDSKPLAPFVYRVLHPALDNLIAPNAKPIELLWVDLLLQVVIVAFTVPLLYRWLRRWNDEDRSMIGVMIFSVVYLMSYHYYFRSIGTSLEILSVVVALCLIDRSWWWFIPMVILASLNRETSLLLPCLYIAWHGKKGLKPFLVLLAIWIAITAGLHIAIGYYPHQLGLFGTFEYNLGNIPEALIANLLLLPIGVMVFAGYRSTPAPLQRVVWLAGIYVLAIVVGGAWNESQRLVLPVLPLVLPLALSYPVRGVIHA